MLIVHLGLSIFLTIIFCCGEGSAEIVLENAEFRLVLHESGKALRLVHKASGQECLERSADVAAFSVTQYRPYNNELQLAYPAKARTFCQFSRSFPHLVLVLFPPPPR